MSIAVERHSSSPFVGKKNFPGRHPVELDGGWFSFGLTGTFWHRNKFGGVRPFDAEVDPSLLRPGPPAH